MSWPISDVSDELQTIMQRIVDAFDGEVVIDSTDHEGDSNWVNFHVPRLTDQCAFMQLEMQKEKLLESLRHEAWRYQILCPSSVATGEGLWAHYADHPDDHRSGFWYF